jgi:excisionase family DNA binding protein
MTAVLSRELPDPAVEPTISVERYAAIVGVSRSGAYEAVRRGEIPAVHIGRRVRVVTARALEQLGLA